MSGAPALGDRSLPEGVVTLVFTDVEGSTRLLRELGPAFAELLNAHKQIIAAATATHGGTVVRVEGDAFFCAFSNPAAALGACLDLQLGLQQFAWPPDGEFRVRVGVHTGQVERNGHDYVGLAVHQAARVADAGHGGQVLLTDSTRQLIGDDLPAGTSLAALGAFRLKDFHEPARLFQLVHPELQGDFPALRALPASAHNIPEPATLFVGRRTALGELAELIRSSRLVTITGAGGVGKTRLATEVVPLVLDQFADGAWLVELAKLRRGQAVAGEIAATLGVRVERDASIQHLLADALQERHMLLLLDNCEHVLHELAPLVAALQGSCPGLHMLATSREPLGVGGECRYPLAPLTIPQLGDAVDSETSEAVALFVDRASVVAPGFDPGSERAAVAEICRRLDGLPLAIELAAARAGAIPLTRLAERLDRRFSLLRQNAHGRLPHHETLRASIEWSYDLLDRDEQLLLARLGVFAGEFELEAAEEIAGAPPLDPDDVLDLLARLIEKSLLQRVGGRYLLLESIRQFAREQLDSEGEADEFVIRHLEHYTQLADTAAQQARGPKQNEALARLDGNLPNIRAAVERALERGDPTAARLAPCLCQYGFMRNRLREVARWCIDAAAISDAPTALRAQALNQAGFALVLLGSPDGGAALVDDALELARAAGDRELLAESLLNAADLHIEAGRPKQAQPYADELLALVRELGDDGLLARALLCDCMGRLEQVGPLRTAERLEEPLRLFERIGDRRQYGRTLLMRAFLWLEAGELERTVLDSEPCTQICEDLDHPIGGAMSRLVLAWVHLDRDELDAADAVLARCATVARDCGYRALLGYCVAAQAAIDAQRGDLQRAAQALGALTPHDVEGGEGARVVAARLAALRAELGERLADQLPALLAEGSASPLEEVLR